LVEVAEVRKIIKLAQAEVLAAEEHMAVVIRAEIQLAVKVFVVDTEQIAVLEELLVEEAEQDNKVKMVLQIKKLMVEMVCSFLLAERQHTMQEAAVLETIETELELQFLEMVD
jgi:hypothetical protein